MNKNNYTVYVHHFPNDKNYVGLTKQKPELRWCHGEGYKSQPVYEAIKYFGWDNIEHIIVKESLNFEEAQNEEVRLIDELDAINNGYNISQGGGLGGALLKKIYYNGEYYTSEELAELSPLKDITGHDITTRLGHGWDWEDILNKPKTQKNVKFEYNGKLYSAKELANMSNIKGLSGSNIYTRIVKHGWDVERAITQPKNVKKQPLGCHRDDKCLYEYNGKIYETYQLLELSEVDGLTCADLTTRINHHHWDIERALTQPKKNRVIIEYNGNKYTSKEIAAMNFDPKVTHHTVTDRFRKGWSIEDIISKPIDLNFVH